MRRPSHGAALLLAAALLPSAPLAAQHYQCDLPTSLRLPQVTPDAPPRRLPITGYTLALSWRATVRSSELQWLRTVLCCCLPTGS